MNDYLPIIQEINRHLGSFNQFLNEDYHIPTLDETTLVDENYFLYVKGKTWKQINFPRKCGVGGVYFYCGRSVKEPEKFCIYIGKASLNATTGQRLYAHFIYAFDDEGNVYNNSRSGERFQIEFIGLIPLENSESICFAPALEEHLIVRWSKESTCELLNVQGNG